MTPNFHTVEGGESRELKLLLHELYPVMEDSP